MRSGSSLSRYSASKSCACLSGPPVSRTADKGRGRATSGTALVIGAACATEPSAATRIIAATRKKFFEFIRIEREDSHGCALIHTVETFPPRLKRPPGLRPAPADAALVEAPPVVF